MACVVKKKQIKACDSNDGRAAYFGQDVFGNLQQGVVSARAAPSLCTPALSHKQRVEQQLGLLKVFGYVHVLVHPKHLRILV